MLWAFIYFLVGAIISLHLKILLKWHWILERPSFSAYFVVYSINYQDQAKSCQKFHVYRFTIDARGDKNARLLDRKWCLWFRSEIVGKIFDSLFRYITVLLRFSVSSFLDAVSTFWRCTLTKEKVWEWYGKTWAIYEQYLGMVWEGWMKIWNWYGAQFFHILMYGKFMGRKADAIHCMGKLWERNFHINPIAVTHLLALCFLWEWYGMSTVQYFIDLPYQLI